MAKPMAPEPSSRLRPPEAPGRPDLDEDQFLPPVGVCRRFWADDAYGRVVVTADGTVRWINATAAGLTGHRPADVIGRNMVEFVAPEDVATVIEAVTEIQAEESVADEGVPMVIGLIRTDGTTTHVEIGAHSWLDDPALGAISLRIRPYDSQRFLERFLTDLVAGAPIDSTLRLLVESLDHLIQSCRAAVVHGWDGTSFPSAVTVALPPVLTGSVEVLAGESERLPWLRCRLSGELEWSRVDELPDRVRAVAVEQGYCACWAAPIVVPAAGVVGVMIVWREASGSPRIGHRNALQRSCQAASLAFERRRAEELLVRAATVDPLTGIPNRSQFFASLEVSMDGARPGRLGVLYLDLDGFKPVNDTHGHRIGDRLLARIGALLQANLRPGDMVARLGGDEFAVLCTDIGSAEELCDVADRLIQVVGQPHALDGIALSIGVSIGVAQAQVHGETLDEVLDAADAALYRAKRAGRGRYRIARALATGLS